MPYYPKCPVLHCRRAFKAAGVYDGVCQTWVLVDVLRRRNRPSYPEDLDVLRSRGEDALGPLGLGRALSAVGAVPAMRIEEQQVQRSALGPFAVG